MRVSKRLINRLRSVVTDIVTDDIAKNPSQWATWNPEAKEWTPDDLGIAKRTIVLVFGSLKDAVPDSEVVGTAIKALSPIIEEEAGTTEDVKTEN